MAIYVAPVVVSAMEGVLEAVPVVDSLGTDLMTGVSTIGSEVVDFVEAGWDSLHRVGGSLLDFVKGSATSIETIGSDVISGVSNSVPVVIGAATVGAAAGAAQGGFSIGSHLIMFGVAAVTVNLLNSLGGDAKRRRIG